MTEAKREPNPSLPGTAEILMHRQLLGPRIYLHTWLRLAVALLILGGTAVASILVGIEGLPIVALTLVGAAVAGYNAIAWFLARSHRKRERTAGSHQRLTLIMEASIVLDFIALTVAIWLVGGARSPFLTFYLPHVIVSYINLSRRAAFSLTLLAYGLLASLVVAEWAGFAPPYLPAGAVGGTGPLDGRFAVTVLVVYGLLFGLISFLLTSITLLLRRGERRIRLANAELMRLSEMRKDFLQTALHNLKSPIGAVTMFIRNIREGLAGPVSEQQAEWLDRSLTRIEGLSEFLENMQTLATVSAGMIAAEAKEMDVAAILRELVETNQDLAQARHHTLTLDCPRTLPPVIGFDRLFREAVVNYVTNAIKYTENGGTIEVRAMQQNDVIRIEVEDNGPGISEEDAKKLFQEFVRLARKGLPSEKEKGSGLGLSIVKRIVEGQGGRVGVTSGPGKGCTFYMELPIAAR